VLLAYALNRIEYAYPDCGGRKREKSRLCALESDEHIISDNQSDYKRDYRGKYHEFPALFVHENSSVFAEIYPRLFPI
jgi:hypothetical protein